VSEEPDDSATDETDDEVLTDCEILTLRIELDLVPQWSNVVEKIARHHGERVVVGVHGPELLVRVAVKPDNKPGMMRDMERYWADFVELRKREGRWTE
jgi:hypothetical protein